MSEWITDRRPTESDSHCGFVWITTERGLVLDEHWKTVRDRPWMPITIPKPYVKPPNRYELVYRSTTCQYYIQDTESCDKRFVASCIPTREKADRILSIIEEQNIMSQWITDRKPTEGDTAAPHYCVFDERGAIVYYTLIKDGEPWKPVQKCEPYVKPKRFAVVATNDSETSFNVQDRKRISNVSYFIPTREAAERIAAIYNEVLS